MISNGNNNISIQFSLQNPFSLQELLLEVEVEGQWNEEGWVGKGLGCAFPMDAGTSRV